MAKATLQAKKENKVTKTVQAKRSNIMENKKQTKPVQAAETKKSEKVVELKKAENKPEENKKAELKVVETPKMTAIEALKSNKNFEIFMKDVPPAIINELAQYPAAQGKEVIEIAELTQNVNSLVKVFEEKSRSCMVLWVVNSLKDELVNFSNAINETTDNNFGIFIFKADLKGSGMAFECVLKPVYKERQTKARGNQFNLDFWTEYSKIANSLKSKINAKPNDRQFKTISAGKTGVAIMQTVSREQLRLGSEIYIQNDKKIYDKLFEHKAEIEKVVGSLEWLRLDNKKASRIVKYINADLLDNSKIKNAINEQIKIGEALQAIVKKYI